MVGGALFFGYYLLSKQKKVTRLKAKKNVSSSTIAPLPNPLDKTTKHLTRLTNYISQVIANPACGRGSKSWILHYVQNDG
jgi:hypothetical protein